MNVILYWYNFVGENSFLALWLRLNICIDTVCTKYILTCKFYFYQRLFKRLLRQTACQRVLYSRHISKCHYKSPSAKKTTKKRKNGKR